MEKKFKTCLDMYAINAWLNYNDLRCENRKTPFLSFLVTFVEEQITKGIQNTQLHLPKREPPSKKKKIYNAVPLYLPVEGQTRCSVVKCQTWTKTICQEYILLWGTVLCYTTLIICCTTEKLSKNKTSKLLHNYFKFDGTQLYQVKTLLIHMFTTHFLPLPAVQKFLMVEIYNF